jgi:SNF2 family DNA or RNA helicase
LNTEQTRLNWVPYTYQRAALDRITQRRAAGINWTPLFMGTGTGKTIVALEDVMRVAELGARKFLIVTPMNVTGSWLDQAELYSLPMRITRVVSSMTRHQRIQHISKHRDYDIMVVNYDTVRMLPDLLCAVEFDYVVFDEIQRLKNVKAKQTESARLIARDVKSRKGMRIGLSGTPAPKDTLDYWSEFDILDPYSDVKIKEYHPLGLGSYREYEYLIARKEPHPRLKGVFTWTFPDMMLDLVKQRVAVHAYQITSEEALPWLPPKRRENIYVDMTDVQSKLYRLMKEDAVLAVTEQRPNEALKAENVETLHDFLQSEAYQKDRSLLKRGVVSAKIETVVMMRLHQITCGHVGLADGSIRTFDNGKINYLEEVLPQWCDPFEDNKTIIFTAYRPNVPMLLKCSEGLNVGALTLTGSNSGKARELVQQFQTDPGVRLFIINLAAGSSGITLTRANRVCYYASTYNWEHRRQSEDRAHRIGQTRSVMYSDLMIRNSIEQYIIKKLGYKEGLARATRTTNEFVGML